MVKIFSDQLWIHLNENRKLQQRNGISRKHKIWEEPSEKYNKKLKVERPTAKEIEKKSENWKLEQ